MSNQNNRVLVRKGARQLSEEEARNVSGGAVAGTLTLCSIGANGKIDGDLHECWPTSDPQWNYTAGRCPMIPCERETKACHFRWRAVQQGKHLCQIKIIESWCAKAHANWAKKKPEMYPAAQFAAQKHCAALVSTEKLTATSTNADQTAARNEQRCGPRHDAGGEQEQKTCHLQMVCRFKKENIYVKSR
jgi:hypothetical protein